MKDNVWSILTCVRKIVIYPSFHFNFPKGVCGSRNLRLLVFAAVLIKLGHTGQFAEFKSRIESLYGQILGLELPSKGL